MAIGNHTYEGYSRIVAAVTPYTLSPGATLIGSTIQKSATTTAWDAGAYSNFGLTGTAYVSAMAGQTTFNGSFGLNSDPASDHSELSLDYAWRTAADGKAYIYVNGSQVGVTDFGSYSTSDVLSISYSGTSISFMINGVVKHTVATTAGRTFYFDSSLGSANFEYNNLQFKATTSIQERIFQMRAFIKVDPGGE